MSLHSANMITPKMIIMNRMVIDTITAVIRLQQQADFVGCLTRDPPNPFTTVKWVELAFDMTSFSFGLSIWFVVIESTVIVNSRFAAGTISVGPFRCILFMRSKLAVVKSLPENVLYDVEWFDDRICLRSILPKHETLTLRGLSSLGSVRLRSFENASKLFPSFGKLSTVGDLTKIFLILLALSSFCRSWWWYWMAARGIFNVSVIWKEKHKIVEILRRGQ